jgi:hypothetical protein
VEALTSLLLSDFKFSFKSYVPWPEQLPIVTATVTEVFRRSLGLLSWLHRLDIIVAPLSSIRLHFLLHFEVRNECITGFFNLLKSGLEQQNVVGILHGDLHAFQELADYG